MANRTGLAENQNWYVKVNSATFFAALSTMPPFSHESLHKKSLRRPATGSPEREPGECASASRAMHAGPPDDRSCNASLIYLPPYSPDFNPIENAFAKLKALCVRRQNERVDGLRSAIGRIIDRFTSTEIRIVIDGDAITLDADAAPSVAVLNLLSRHKAGGRAAAHRQRRLVGRGLASLACGDQGIWSRWCSYVATGHGGNVELRALVNDPTLEYCRKAFRFALLEYRPAPTPDELILAREGFWKRILLTRGDFGLNRN
jgi:DDE superfamily endonuclease